MKTTAAQHAIHIHEYDLAPNAWTMCARRAFANLLRFGPCVLNQSSINMLKKKRLVCTDGGGRIVPEEWALAAWNRWVVERRIRSIAAANRKIENMPILPFALA